MVQKVRTKQK